MKIKNFFGKVLVVQKKAVPLHPLSRKNQRGGMKERVL